MTIPKIASYKMPEADMLRPNRVNWQLSAQRAVLLIHDMQDYFLDFFDRESSPVIEMIDNLQRVRSACLAANIPVVYTAQPAQQSSTERGLLQDMWGPGITAHAERSKIVRALEPRSSDFVLTKWRYSAFQRTELYDLLGELGRDQLIIGGVYAHIGCLMTANDAFMHDVQAFLISDAMGDFSLSEHLMALNYAAQRCAATLPSRAVVSALADSLQSLTAEVTELVGAEPDSIAGNDNLFDAGLDSLRLMSLVERFRSRGCDVSFVDLAEQPTLDAWRTLLSERRSA
jgi:bifunctional isochorismate lyase/aryl carrier protein